MFDAEDSLVAYRKSTVVPEVAEALRQLELKAATDPTVQLVYKGPVPGSSWETFKPTETASRPHLSMALAGREVRLRIQFKDRQSTREEELARLWSIAVPLGFVPWNRYPSVGAGDEIFHFFGVFQGVYDSLCGEGLGDWAFPSVCAAALTDVGMWKGDREVEHFLMGQLHRLGAPCGPVNGVVSPRVLESLQVLGLRGILLQRLLLRWLGWKRLLLKRSADHMGT